MMHSLPELGRRSRTAESLWFEILLKCLRWYAVALQEVLPRNAPSSRAGNAKEPKGMLYWCPRTPQGLSICCTAGRSRVCSTLGDVQLRTETSPSLEGRQADMPPRVADPVIMHLAHD